MDQTNQSAQTPVTPSQTPATPPPAVPTPQPAVQPPAGSAKKNKAPLIAGLIVAGLLVAGAVAYGVYAYMTNQPDYLLKRSIEQLSQETVFAAKFKATTGTESNGTTFSGDIAARGDEASKNGEVVVGVGSGDTRVTLTARVISENLFLRFGSLGNFGNLMESLAPGQESGYDTPEFKQALEGVNDKWFSLTKEELANIAQSTGASATSSFKPEDYKKLVEIYNKHQVFRADKTFADETVEGTNTAHFSVKIDKAALKSFLTELKAANLQSFTVTDQDIAEAEKAADDFAKNAVVEFWVARDSQKMKQAKFTSTEAGSEGSLTLTFVTELPQFEKLEEPQGASPFSELMTLILGPMYSTSLQESEYELEESLVE
jgi:hypothetical protein